MDYTIHPRNVSNIPIVSLESAQENNADNLYEAQMKGLRRKSLDELQKDGVSYLITNKWFYEPYLKRNIEDFNPIMKVRINEVRDFYKKLKVRGKRIIDFKPDFWRPGPLIEIYDISRLY